MTFIPATPAGPIFATFKINGLDCLELIGVVKGCLGKRPDNVTALNGDKLTGLFQHSGFATIAPLDDLMPPRSNCPLSSVQGL